MSVTAGQLLQALHHRLAGPIAPELGGGTRVLNLAGQWMDGIHAWQQRLRVSAALNFTAGDTTIALPSNLRSIDAAEQASTTSTGRSVSWVGPADMLYLRTGQAIAGGFDLYVSIETSGTGWELGLYQPPDTTTPDILNITYKAGWTDVVNDKSTITVHDSQIPLLTHIVREFAAGLELNDLDERMTAIENGSLMRAAKRADASAQRMLGPIQGGAVAMRNQVWDPWRVETQVLPS